MKLSSDCDFLTSPIEYRERTLCKYCVARWQELEKLMGREINFTEMTLRSKKDHSNDERVVEAVECECTTIPLLPESVPLGISEVK